MQEDKFQIYDEFEHDVLNWLCSQEKIFYTTGISNFPGQWKKCVSVKVEYLEKE
jgi:hypothetical protein